jgi:hypothetical protein
MSEQPVLNLKRITIEQYRVILKQAYRETGLELGIVRGMFQLEYAYAKVVDKINEFFGVK